MLEVGEEMVLCPYNRCHLVKKLRIQKHILKCKKNYPEMKLVTCAYNYTHRLKPEDMLEHYETCRYKMRLDNAGYYKHDDYGRDSSVKSERQSIRFPNINFKPSVSLESRLHSQMEEDLDSQHQESDSDSEMPPLKRSSPDAYDSDNDSDLEPLPLPKTVSKAFVCVKEPEKYDLSHETSEPKVFGRGRNFSKIDSLERIKSPWFSVKNDDSICNQSVRSSMFDDVTTLQSVDMSIDEDFIDDAFLKDLDKYVKI